jgi:hypothetical protein
VGGQGARLRFRGRVWHPRFTELIIDAVDPSGLAEFWAAVLGWQSTGSYGGGVIELAPPGGDSRRS